jgi:hypothetical protein
MPCQSGAYPRTVASRSRAAIYARRRRGRIAKVVHDLTDVQWAALLGAWAGCAYCGVNDDRLQKDCMLPVSRGGRYTITNVVPACGACNASKCNAEVTVWMRRKKLDEHSFLTRQVEIARAVGTRTDHG